MVYTRQVAVSDWARGVQVAEAGDERKFQQIADAVRAAIVNGTYLPGKRLPGEDALAKENSTSLTTVRAAIQSLVAEGVLETRPRSGTYVRRYRRVLRNANERLAATQWKSGHDIWDVDAAGRKRDVDSIEVFRTEAPLDVAKRLGTSDVWVRKRRYLIDNQPVQIATSYLPVEIVEGSAITTPDTGPGGTYARLTDLGFEPVEFIERLITRMPVAAEVKVLHLGAATPVAQIRREAATVEGRIVEVNDMVCAGDAYVFQWSFSSSS